MNLELARTLADIADAAYETNPLKAGRAKRQPPQGRTVRGARKTKPLKSGLMAGLKAERLDKFGKLPCRGFVASDDETVVLSFRGTVRKINKFEDFVDSLSQWLINFNFAQTSRNGYRVHRGFDGELNSVYREIKTMVRDHGGDRKTLLVTGHSAGGALATLAARRLKEDGVPVDAAFVYASPRVGDEKYRDSYNVPLYRLEYQDDIVPHLPFPPSVMALCDPIIRGVHLISAELFPHMSLAALRNVEYVHAGQLFFVDWDNSLIRSTSLRDAIDAIFEDDSVPWMSMQKTIFDVARFGKTIFNIGDYLRQGSLEFFGHHRLSGVAGFFRTLLGKA